MRDVHVRDASQKIPEYGSASSRGRASVVCLASIMRGVILRIAVPGYTGVTRPSIVFLQLRLLPAVPQWSVFSYLQREQSSKNSLARQKASCLSTYQHLNAMESGMQVSRAACVCQGPSCHSCCCGCGRI